MPIRVKSRPHSQVEPGVRTPSPYGAHSARGIALPEIDDDDCFREVIKKLSIYIGEAITLPSTFEQLRTTSVGDSLRVLVDHLSNTCTNPAIVNALLSWTGIDVSATLATGRSRRNADLHYERALKFHYGAAGDNKALNEARASGCEIVAWRFLTHLSEREVLDFCLYEIPGPQHIEDRRNRDEEAGDDCADETTALLVQAWNNTSGSARRVAEGTASARRYQLLQSISRLTMTMTGDEAEEDDPTAPFVNLNALEIAAISDAKRFLSQNVVQKIITGIWNGDIIFWDSLSVHATKQPRFYNPKTADIFSRLRVPKYLKSFEVLFFASFLFLYYSVLVERNPDRITTLEVFLYIWLAAFLYDELSEWIDAGSIFYAVDVWNMFDMIMICIGIVFAALRIIGLSKRDEHLIDMAYDVLALEALFMVPRVCSILSLSPYWGTLIPCLKEMGKDFVKFMVLVIVVYLGFLTTFSLVGRESYSFATMTMVLTKIFFGNSSEGFDKMRQIDPVFGPPLMIVFVTLSSILLMGSLTGMLSNSFSRVITHAREEYLYVYSVYVLEASTSNRLTHFYPPFNLIALVIFRPLRLFLPSHDRFRAGRILLLKATHLPVVAAIHAYEFVRTRICGRRGDAEGLKTHFRGPPQQQNTPVSNFGSTPRKQRGSARPLAHARPSSSYRPGVITDDDKVGAGGEIRTREGGNPETRAGREAQSALAGTGAEARMAQLEDKIDRLMELVVMLQTQHSRSLTDVGVAS